MKTMICILAVVLAPVAPAAAEKPEWAFPVTEKELPQPRIEGSRMRTVPGSPVTISRAAADDFFNAPDWRPDLHPPMPKIVQYGDKETQVRACGSCHLPTGNGHDEFAYVAGLPVGYFMRQMADWKSGERKFGGIMVQIAKAATDAEVRSRPSISPRSSRGPGFGSSRPTLSRKALSAPATNGWNWPPAAANRWATDHRSAGGRGSGGLSRSDLRLCCLCAEGQRRQRRGPGHNRRRQDAPCAICHGPTLQGLGDVPAIAGRHPNYIVRQLWNIQNGDRGGPSAALMKAVVERLNNDDMLAIAAYVASRTP